jgi:hypothetical protein
MSKLRANSIGGKLGTGNATVAAGNNIIANEAVAPGMVVQVGYASVMPTSHISSASATPVSAPLRITFTPKYANSILCVQFFSTMCYGAGGWLITTLRRSNDNGVTFTILTPDTRAAARYQYGWNYFSNTWCPMQNVFFDTANSITPIIYDIQYASSGTNYLVHQYEEYGWEITEIAQ